MQMLLPGHNIEWKSDNFLLNNPKTANFPLDPKKIRKSADVARPWWLYALELENGRYYVGITSKKNPYDRILQHDSGFGARWTMLYKPARVIEIRDIGYATKQEAEDYEQNLTWVYMTVYGHKRVRGGTLTYTGSYLRLGNYMIPGYVIQSLIAGLLLILLSAYVIINELG